MSKNRVYRSCDIIEKQTQTRLGRFKEILLSDRAIDEKHEIMAIFVHR